MSEDTHNGWTNRETWAVALHINNDQGWQAVVHEALDELVRASLDPKTDPTLSRDAGYIVRNSVEEALEMLLDAVETAEPNLHTGNPTGARETYESVREDIGSLWRVNWDELGAAFLSDLEE